MQAKTIEQENIASEPTLSPSEVKEMLIGIYKAGRFTRTNCLLGAPGIGKTSITRQTAKELGINYIEINPTMPADEVCGIPDLIRVEGQDTKTDYAMPAWFPNDPEWQGIICLDDALQGDRMMQQTIANLIHARNLRGHPLPDGAMLILTGNRLEDKAGVTKTLSHLADRLDYINIEADPTAWIDDFAVPSGIDPRVIAWIHMDKAKLNMFDPNAKKSPTSRSWEAVSDALFYLDTIKGEPYYNKFAHAKLSGAIGVGPAIEFWAFCTRFEDMPNLDDIIKNPETHKIDYKLDIQYAIAIGLSNYVDNKSFGPAVKFLSRMTPDMMVLMVKLAIKRSPALKESQAWREWALANQEILTGGLLSR